MIIFVGDKPSPKMKPGAEPFEGAACEQRLKDWISYVMPVDSTYMIVNQTEGIKLTGWLSVAIYHNYPVIALGNNAHKAVEYMEPFKLPHPSGRNRQINDKEFIAKKLAECKAHIEGKL